MSNGHDGRGVELHAQNKFDADERLTDDTARGLIRDLMTTLYQWMLQIRAK